MFSYTSLLNVFCILKGTEVGRYCVSCKRLRVFMHACPPSACAIIAVNFSTALTYRHTQISVRPCGILIFSTPAKCAIICFPCEDLQVQLYWFPILVIFIFEFYHKYVPTVAMYIARLLDCDIRCICLLLICRACIVTIYNTTVP